MLSIPWKKENDKALVKVNGPLYVDISASFYVDWMKASEIIEVDPSQVVYFNTSIHSDLSQPLQGGTDISCVIEDVLNKHHTEITILSDGMFEIPKSTEFSVNILMPEYEKDHNVVRDWNDWKPSWVNL